MSKTLQLTKQLISKPSITPDDKGCQEIMIKRLEAIGFNIERLPSEDVDNFWARRGTEGPLIAFAGHTDVVPTGPVEQWSTDPFTPTIKDGMLYGRGAADMKGSLAAMITAVEEFIKNNPDHKGSIAFLITSDEEGPSVHGTLHVVEHLQARNEKIDYCIVGEPSSEKQLGDIIKVGRRGSLGGKLQIKGVQGHIAYPDKTINPIHKAMPALHELVETHWDSGNKFFPATSFQISNIHAGTGANNVIPGECEVLFNFRYSTENTADELSKKVEDTLKKHELDYSIDWHNSGLPFLTKEGVLTDAVCSAIKEVTGVETTPSTIGGTSDGRFIAPTGTEVVELGPCNATIHKIDECVSVEELDQLAEMYERILEKVV